MMIILAFSQTSLCSDSNCHLSRLSLFHVFTPDEDRDVGFGDGGDDGLMVSMNIYNEDGSFITHFYNSWLGNQFFIYPVVEF